MSRISEIRNMVLAYEDSLWSGTLKSYPNERVPHGYLSVFKCHPDAYHFHRHEMFNFVARSGESSSLIAEFEIIRSKLIEYDKQNGYIIRQYLKTENGLNKLVDRLRNIREMYTELLPQSDGQIYLTRTWLNYYVSTYEVTEYLLMLLMILQALNGMEIDTTFSAMRDRKGNVVKGRVINRIRELSGDYPVLNEYFCSGFNPGFRNSIGHNNYRIDGNMFIDLDGALSIDIECFRRMNYHLQEIHSAIFNFMNLHAINTDKIVDCGTISVGYQSNFNGIPALNIFELWSFSSISQDLSWLHTIKVNANKLHLKLKLNGRIIYKNLWDKELVRWYDLTKDNDKILVRVITIQPHINHNETDFNIRGKDYEVLSSKVLGYFPISHTGRL